MRLNLSPDLSRILDLVRSEVDPDQQLYIVGGAVRDLLLGHELNDLDFVLSENPTNLAKNVAFALNAGFFVLDDDRKTARVVYHFEGGQLFPLDFVRFTREDLLSDLQHRDFTINAIAIKINTLEKFIDPLGGIKDLADGLLRLCSDQSLLDDPVRVLRGIRLAMQFNFRYTANMPGLMKEASKHLSKTSYERQRDEFFKILEGPNPAEGMMDCRRFNVFDSLIPPLTDQEDVPASPPHTLALFDHTIRVIKYLAILIKFLDWTEKAGDKLPWWLSDFLLRMEKFSEKMKGYMDEEITPGRSKRGLLLFSGLLHDIGKPETLTVGEDGYLHFYNHADVGEKLAWEAARNLKLSNAESEWVRKTVAYHMSLLPLINKDRKPSSKEVHRYYKKTGETGVAVALLSLGDTLATYNQNLSEEKWHQALDVCEVMLSAWWEDQERVITPKLILDGNDLQERFGLQPGKTIGLLLEKLEEAQAEGKVQTEQEAEIFIHKEMKGSGNESED